MSNNIISNSSRNNNIGILHLIGALFVMYGHQCILMGHPVTTLFGCGIHAVGVKVIFIISGYLITKSICSLKGNRMQVSLQYSIKRLTRIYPEYLGCILVAAFVIGPLFSTLTATEYFSEAYFHNGVLFYITTNLRMFINYSLPGVFSNNPISQAVNGSFWTLPVELSLYLVIWCVIIVSKNSKLRKLLFVIITVILSILSIVRLAVAPSSYLVWYGTDWYQALNVAPYFLIGAMSSQIDLQKYLHPELAAIVTLCFSGISFGGYYSEITSLILIPYIVLSIGFSNKLQGIHLRFVRSEYAYGMFLYSFMIQQCVLDVLGKHPVLTPNVNTYFFISTIITYFVAMLSYKLFYEPVKLIIGKIHFLTKREKQISNTY